MNQPQRRELLNDVLEVIASLVRTIHIRRALHNVHPEPHLNFWRVIYGDLTDFAVLEWCKLFGSDDEEHQAIHWKNMAPNQEAFRQALLTHLHLSLDQAVAHRDLKRKAIPRFPNFDVALESAYFYYGVVLSELREQGIELGPRDIREYAARFFAQARTVASAATDATKSI